MRWFKKLFTTSFTIQAPQPHSPTENDDEESYDDEPEEERIPKLQTVVRNRVDQPTIFRRFLSIDNDIEKFEAIKDVETQIQDHTTITDVLSDQPPLIPNQLQRLCGITGVQVDDTISGGNELHRIQIRSSLTRRFQNITTEELHIGSEVQFKGCTIQRRLDEERESMDPAKYILIVQMNRKIATLAYCRVDDEYYSLQRQELGNNINTTKDPDKKLKSKTKTSRKMGAIELIPEKYTTPRVPLSEYDTSQYKSALQATNYIALRFPTTAADAAIAATGDKVYGVHLVLNNLITRLKAEKPEKIFSGPPLMHRMKLGETYEITGFADAGTKWRRIGIWIFLTKVGEVHDALQRTTPTTIWCSTIYFASIPFSDAAMTIAQCGNSSHSYLIESVANNILVNRMKSTALRLSAFFGYYLKKTALTDACSLTQKLRTPQLGTTIADEAAAPVANLLHEINEGSTAFGFIDEIYNVSDVLTKHSSEIDRTKWRVAKLAMSGKLVIARRKFANLDEYLQEFRGHDT